MTGSDAEVDVVVVGAGIAGLACALHLSRAGRTVAVLEAGDAVGGRVRTDVVDGWRLDRGFQVHDTAYPELTRLLDSVTGGTATLGFRAFTTGALVHLRGRFHRVADPRRHPLGLLSTVRAPIGSLADRAATVALVLRLLATPAQRLLDAPETSTAEWLRHNGIGPLMVERFWQPFFAGVFGEDELRTSSRFAALVLRSQAHGRQVLPADGIGAIPELLLDGLPAGCVRLSTEVVSVRAGEVRCAGGAVLRARAVVVAADPAAAHGLLPELGPAPRLNPLTTHYFAAPDLAAEPVIRLEGGGRAQGPIANTAVIPSRQPGVLLAATALGDDQALPDMLTQLRRWHGPRVDDWEHLAVRTGATVDGAPPLGRLRKPVTVAPGLFVASDARDSPSTQGAAVSGRRAADSALAHLGRS